MDFVEERPKANIIIRTYSGVDSENQARTDAHFHCTELACDGYIRVESCWYPDTKELKVIYIKMA